MHASDQRPIGTGGQTMTDAGRDDKPLTAPIPPGRPGAVRAEWP